MTTEANAKYIYQVKSINLKGGTTVAPGRINVFVGANNCGKTQLLKDMLNFILGERTSAVLLENLEIPYPNILDELMAAYAYDIVDGPSGTQQLRLISPTLDSKPTGLALHNLESELKRQLSLADKREFRKSTGAGLVTYLNTDNRLKLAQKCSAQNLQTVGPKNVLEALYQADLDAPCRIRELVQTTFNTDIYFDYTDPGTLQFRIGNSFSAVSENSRIAYAQVSNYPILDNQGDGLRSYVGILSALISLDKPIILLDEPEAFLHPPQALQLGMSINELIKDDQQIFISTHSADFLRGLLSSTGEATIVHLTRDQNNHTTFNVLDQNVLKKIITDPLLSSSRVLEGMFYKGVVATEADADAVFYQRLFQKRQEADEIHFVNAHNKQTLKKVIEPYQSLGIKFALIADADVIRDRVEFLGIIDGIATEEMREIILKEREKVYTYFQKQEKWTILDQLRTNTREYANKDIPSKDASKETIESALFDFRRILKKLRDEADELSELKKSGRVSLEKDQETLDAFDSLLEHCAARGLFIVPVGELESWLVDYGVPRSSNKTNWIVTALDKLFEISYDENKEIWKFIDKLRAYLST